MSIIEKNLKYFRSELDDLLLSFFAWEYINQMAIDDNEIFNALNINALSWNTFQRSLQSTFFITLGRIFDNKKKKDRFSIYNLLDKCIENIHEFSKNSLRLRKIKINGGNEPDWLEDYMKDTYEARREDVVNLKKEIEEKIDIVKNYKVIRHNVFAHKNNKIIGKTGFLFEKTDKSEIEEILLFLDSIYNYLWELFNNGRQYSITDFKEIKVKKWIRDDIKSLLETIKKNS